MSSSGPVCFLACLVSATLCAGPTDTAIVAAMRLSEEPNYSWVSFVRDDARSYEIDGKLLRDGLTWVRMPMIDFIAERLGRDADYHLEAIFKGNAACVIRTDQGWKTVAELPRPIPHDFDEGYVIAAPGRDPSEDDAAAEIPGSARPTLLERMLADDRAPTYTNLQLAVSPPHEELAIIVSCGQGLAADGATVSGALSDRGAQLLLLPAPQKGISPLAASGAFRLWVRDNHVFQYEVQLEAVLLVGKRKVLVHQLTQTVVRALGTTTLEVPDEARLKLANLQ